MHAYRDAIEGTRSAWVLYPGETFAFFGVNGVSVSDANDLGAVEPRGVGAVPLVPGSGGTAAITRVVARLLSP